MSSMLILLLWMSLSGWSHGEPALGAAKGSRGLSAVAAPSSSSRAQQKNPEPPNSSPWTLVWSDEFNGQDGAAPDPAKWVVETGGGGWGNHELEYYTNRVQNVQTQDGKLVMTARREGYSDAHGVLYGYTSARLKTLHKFE